VQGTATFTLSTLLPHSLAQSGNGKVLVGFAAGGSLDILALPKASARSWASNLLLKTKPVPPVGLRLKVPKAQNPMAKPY
jgi:hypothetical protein